MTALRSPYPRRHPKRVAGGDFKDVMKSVTANAAFTNYKYEMLSDFPMPFLSVMLGLHGSVPWCFAFLCTWLVLVRFFAVSENWMLRALFCVVCYKSYSLVLHVEVR